jgi:signal transduction histidine kinase
MRFNSIKFQAMVLLALALTIPVIIVGSAGFIYYRDVIKQNIWDDSLAQAKAISMLTDTYVGMGKTYLESIADRPLVIKALEDNNQSFLNYTTEYTVNNSHQFNEAYITDISGKIISCYPRSDLTGKNVISEPLISDVIKTDKPSVSDGMRNDITGMPTVYIGIPIDDESGNVLGALVGGMDLKRYSSAVVDTQVINAQYIYLVNKTGHVMLHNNQSYMNAMADFSGIRSVQKVINGEEGIDEQYFPPEKDLRLESYSPITDYGWGVVVSLPVDIAYKPINDSTSWFLGFTLVLLVFSLILAIIVGGYIVDPLVRISNATKEIPEGDIQKYAGIMPLKRMDEIGELARSVLDTSNIIKTDRERILKSKNDAELARAHAEEERKRSDFYVDVMGHDINNLNQAALLNIEALQADKALTNEQRTLIDNALTAVLGSAGIIENVRRVQQITSEDLHLEKVDLDKSISQCIKDARRPADKMVVINYDPKEGRLVVATPLLKDVFGNLIDNSIKYSGSEVTIDINVKESYQNGEKYYDIEIADNGNGIPDSLKQKIFRRLWRGTTRATGKGLGLFIVKTLIERFGGSVTVEDRIPGDHTKGSRFIVRLPAYEGG